MKQTVDLRREVGIRNWRLPSRHGADLMWTIAPARLVELIDGLLYHSRVNEPYRAMRETDWPSYLPSNMVESEPGACSNLIIPEQ